MSAGRCSAGGTCASGIERARRRHCVPTWRSRRVSCLLSQGRDRGATGIRVSGAGPRSMAEAHAPPRGRCGSPRRPPASSRRGRGSSPGRHRASIRGGRLRRSPEFLRQPESRRYLECATGTFEPVAGPPRRSAFGPRPTESSHRAVAPIACFGHALHVQGRVTAAKRDGTVRGYPGLRRGWLAPTKDPVPAVGGRGRHGGALPRRAVFAGR